MAVTRARVDRPRLVDAHGPVRVLDDQLSSKGCQTGWGPTPTPWWNGAAGQSVVSFTTRLGEFSGALVHGCGLTRLADPIQPSTLGTGYENHYSVSCSFLSGGVVGRWMRRQRSCETHKHV